MKPAGVMGWTAALFIGEGVNVNTQVYNKMLAENPKSYSSEAALENALLASWSALDEEVYT